MAFTEKYVSSLAGGSGNGLSEGTAFTWGQMITEISGATSKAGTRYNVKADGTYTRSTNDSMYGAIPGTTSSPIYIRGYKTVIGDGYLGRDAVGALVTTNMPQINYTDGRVELPEKTVFESISLAYTATGGGYSYPFAVNHNCSVIGCKVTTARTSGDSKISSLGGEFAIHFECDYFLTATSGPNQEMAFTQSQGVRLDSCRFICSCTTIQAGVKFDDIITFYGCLIKGAGAGAGIYANGNKSALIRNNTISNWQDGIFWDLPTNDRNSWIAGNMLTDNSRYGVNVSAAWVGIIGPNRVRDNVTGNTSNATLDWANTGRILSLVTTDTGGPETDYAAAASNNYQIISASPGIAGNRPKFSDMGAYGLQHPTGGGSAVFNPLAQTIIRAA